MFGLQDMLAHFPFSVVCRAGEVEEEVVVECPSYPEHCTGPERGVYMAVQHEMWKSTEEQL